MYSMYVCDLLTIYLVPHGDTHLAGHFRGINFVNFATYFMHFTANRAAIQMVSVAVLPGVHEYSCTPDMTMSRLDLYMAMGQIDRYEYYSEVFIFRIC